MRRRGVCDRAGDGAGGVRDAQLARQRLPHYGREAGPVGPVDALLPVAAGRERRLPAAVLRGVPLGVRPVHHRVRRDPGLPDSA